MQFVQSQAWQPLQENEGNIYLNWKHPENYFENALGAVFDFGIKKPLGSTQEASG